MKRAFIKKILLGGIISLILPLSIAVNGKTVLAADNNKVLFGVISDNHVTEDKPVEQSRLAKAFKVMRNQKVNAAIVVGDLTDNGNKLEYDTWRRIKDNNIGNIKLIASMGNHEDNTPELFTDATGDAPNANYIVNGYHFITLSPGSGSFNLLTGKGDTQGGSDYSYVVNWLKVQLKQAVAEDPKKPVFVFFHHPLQNTYYASDEWYGTGLASGKGETFQSVFSKYPQVVTFSGHIHSPNNTPTSIWQDGGFTAVNTTTTSDFEMETGMVSGIQAPDGHNAAQELLVEATGSKVTIHNYDMISDQYIPQTWTFDVTKPEKFPYTNARVKLAKAPVFQNDAKVKADSISENGAVLKFDQAIMKPNIVSDIVHSYKYDIFNKSTGKLYQSFKTWSKFYQLPMPSTLTQEVTGLLPATEYEVKIYAIDAFGKVSADHISTSFKTEDLPTADLLDVTFSSGMIKDLLKYPHTFITKTGANMVYDPDLKKCVAKFSEDNDEGYLTQWTSEQYKKASDGYSIETVFKLDSSSHNLSIFGNTQNAGLGLDLSHDLNVDNANLELWCHTNGSYKMVTARNSIELEKWYHAVGVYNGSEMKLYLNGELVDSIDMSGSIDIPAAPSQYYVVGGDISENSEVETPFGGSISIVRMYSEPLSNEDVYRLACHELNSNDIKLPIVN